MVSIATTTLRLPLYSHLPPSYCRLKTLPMPSRPLPCRTSSTPALLSRVQIFDPSSPRIKPKLVVEPTAYLEDPEGPSAYDDDDEEDADWDDFEIDLDDPDSDIESSSSEGSPVMYVPHGKYAFAARGVLEDRRPLGHLHCTYKEPAVQTGHINGERIQYVTLIRCSVFVWRKEIFLFSNQLRPVQGVVVPWLIRVEPLKFGFVTYLMEPPGQKWSHAHPNMSHTEKKLIIRAYERLHLCGVLHGDVQLRHILVSGSKALIVDFQKSASLFPNRSVELPKCTQDDLMAEMEDVKWLIDFEGTRGRRGRRTSRRGSLSTTNVPAPGEDVREDEEPPLSFEIPDAKSIEAKYSRMTVDMLVPYLLKIEHADMMFAQAEYHMRRHINDLNTALDRGIFLLTKAKRDMGLLSEDEVENLAPMFKHWDAKHAGSSSGSGSREDEEEKGKKGKERERGEVHRLPLAWDLPARDGALNVDVVERPRWGPRPTREDRRRWVKEANLTWGSPTHTHGKRKHARSDEESMPVGGSSRSSSSSPSKRLRRTSP
ncbi:hypothetical protein BOTBODRAFT_192145 [Botryobasidium botryosum FD-172 SS1]|uniref:Protein kinase domain-containing protein n=1 Tax=Botryobasidium botryosum (strain FD-172 SS1) TaxID=930990 RepID=A0A067M8K1_BOTB1|nr:hypothetical protein BOTBODRAFT_192145 [Botryobasidium botryosum FD-172 SS1]